MLFGCAPEVWQDVMSEYHAFSERVGEEVALRPLTDEHMTDLVSNYLDRARSETRENGVTDPFTHESLNVILQRSQGNIRQALSICSRVLDRAADTNQKEITGEFIQESI